MSIILCALTWKWIPRSYLKSCSTAWFKIKVWMKEDYIVLNRVLFIVSLTSWDHIGLGIFRNLTWIHRFNVSCWEVCKAKLWPHHLHRTWGWTWPASTSPRTESLPPFRRRTTCASLQTSRRDRQPETNKPISKISEFLDQEIEIKLY